MPLLRQNALISCEVNSGALSVTKYLGIPNLQKIEDSVSITLLEVRDCGRLHSIHPEAESTTTRISPTSGM